MDQRSDPGDQQHETDRQLVDLETEVDLQTVDRDPGEQVFDDGPRIAVATEHVASSDRPTPNDASAARQPSQCPHRSVRLPPSSKIAAPAAGNATSSQVKCVIPQPLSRLASSTEADLRARKIVMMMASPITTSHAATTMVKNATIWPSR